MCFTNKLDWIGNWFWKDDLRITNYKCGSTDVQSGASLIWEHLFLKPRDTNTLRDASGCQTQTIGFRDIPLLEGTFYLFSIISFEDSFQKLH